MKSLVFLMLCQSFLDLILRIFLACLKSFNYFYKKKCICIPIYAQAFQQEILFAIDFISCRFVSDPHIRIEYMDTFKVLKNQIENDSFESSCSQQLFSNKPWHNFISVCFNTFGSIMFSLHTIESSSGFLIIPSLSLCSSEHFIQMSLIRMRDM